MKYSKRLKTTGATGIVLAMTANFAEAVVNVVSVNQVVSISGTPTNTVSFDPVSSDYVSESDFTYDARATRACNLELASSNGMMWTDAAVNLGDTVDGSLTFVSSVSTSVPAEGATAFWGYAYTSGTDTFYGFAQLTGLSTGGFAKDFNFDGYAFEDSASTGITTSAVPEPSSMAAVIAISAGLFTLQRRKRR